MNKKLCALTLGLFINAFGMEPEGFFKFLPKELLGEISQFIANFKALYTFDDLLKQLKEASSTGSPLFKGLYDQLNQIKSLKYEAALKKLKELSQNKNFSALFTDPDFNRIIIADLYNKRPDSASTLAKALGTPGALTWQKQLELIDANLDKVKELLAQGIDVNVQDMNGKTALMNAVLRQNKDVVAMLINANANVNSQDRFGNSALIYATIEQPQRTGSAALLPVVYKDIVQMLIKAKADVNVHDQDKMTPLMHAIQRRDKDLVQIFLNAGADINAQDQRGNTPLIYAAFYNNPEALEQLLARKADVSVKNVDNQTALSLAKDPNIKQLLLKHGAK